MGELNAGCSICVFLVDFVEFLEFLCDVSYNLRTELESLFFILINFFEL